MKLQASKILKQYGIVFVLFFVVIFFSIANPKFAQLSNFITVIRQTAIVCVCGVGMLFVLVSGGIDLSVGWMISAVCMLAGHLMVNLKVNPILACLMVFCVMMAVGALMGLTIAKLRIAPFIVTMSFMNILKGFSFLITQGKSIYGLPPEFVVIGQEYYPIILMAVALLLGWFVLRRTYFGRHFYALGSNEEATRLSGINVIKVKVATYMISAFFATFAGLIMLGRIKTASAQLGTGYEFDVITACVLGGVGMSGGSGKVYHVLVGALLIAIINNGLIILQVSEYIQVILKGLVLLLAVIYDCVQKNRKR